MRIFGSALCVLLSSVGPALAQTPAAEQQALTTTSQKASYGIGLSIGRNMAKSGMKIDLDLFARGMRDAFSGAKPLASDDDIETAINAFQRAAVDNLANRNSDQGATFLAENAKKPNVKTLPSGLQYKVLRPGTGSQPKATDTVRTHYRGTLINGTEFDSSYKRGEPAEFGVGQVIKGWSEALQLMKVGAKWQLVIPAELAYGKRGVPGIPPNSVLLFDIELLEIK